MQKDKPYLDFSVFDESKDYYNVPSFNSLNGKSVDDDLFDKESDELLKNGNARDSLGEGNSLMARYSYKNEKGSLSNPTQDKDMDQGIDPVSVNKIDFNNSVFREEDSRVLKDVKLNIEAIEMTADRPDKTGIVLQDERDEVEYRNQHNNLGKRQTSDYFKVAVFIIFGVQAGLN